MQPSTSLLSAEEKSRLYVEAFDEISAIWSEEGGQDLDEIALMATINSVLSQRFGYFFWTGFYRACGDRLIVGPYVGAVGCLQIAAGQGVCGAAYARGETMIVPDVTAFPGHIACDARSRSEIVVPIRGRQHELTGVLDVDSEQLNAFDDTDRAGLERICALFEQ